MFVVGQQEHGSAHVFVDNVGAICDNVAWFGSSQKLKSRWGWVRHSGQSWTVASCPHGTLATGAVQRPSTGTRHLQGLASQETLCTFHTCKRHIQSRHLENGQIWDEVLAELRCFRVLLLDLSSSWRLHVCDASLHGRAVAHSFWPRETVAQVVRTLESPLVIHSCDVVNGNTRQKGTWRFSEDISMLQALATVFSMRRLARKQ